MHCHLSEHYVALESKIKTLSTYVDRCILMQLCASLPYDLGRARPCHLPISGRYQSGDVLRASIYPDSIPNGAPTNHCFPSSIAIIDTKRIVTVTSSPATRLKGLAVTMISTTQAVFIIAHIFLLSHILMLVIYLQQLKPNSDSNAQIEKRSMHGSMASVAKARTPSPVSATTTAAATSAFLSSTHREGFCY